MVALKYWIWTREKRKPQEKQERRGGIEMALPAGPSLNPAWKQESRGGIEIPDGTPRISNPFSEAGTPWWH